MIIGPALWAWFGAVPARVKIYIGVAIAIVIALWRWRAAGINAAIDKIKLEEKERAQRIKEQIAVSRSNHPDGDNDIIERLRKHGNLRD